MPVRTEKLIYTEFDGDGNIKSNKYYLITEKTDGTVHAEWGRYIEQGGQLVKGQEKDYPAGTFDTKVREKVKKGYTPVPVVDSAAQAKPGKPVANTSLEAIALKQIQYKHSDVPDFIKYLCQSNVHQITANTALTYNADTGVFSTAMGLITQAGIDEARKYLSQINNLLTTPTSTDFQSAVGSYMRIIPQDIGRRRANARDVFPDLVKVQSQNDILDGLEASLTEVSKPKVKDGEVAQPQEEKLFDTSIELLDDSKEFNRIVKMFNSTAKDMHYAVKGMRVRRIFVVSINPMNEAFNIVGLPLSNHQELWHGTGTANLLSILKTGFKVLPPATAAIAGKAFGNGIYHANSSTKSLQYARGVWSGSHNSRCYMFMNDVALGNYYVPKSSTRDNPPKGYDSYWAKAGQTGYLQNDELIVFNSGQIKPKYLLEIE